MGEGCQALPTRLRRWQIADWGLELFRGGPGRLPWGAKPTETSGAAATIHWIPVVSLVDELVCFSEFLSGGATPWGAFGPMAGGELFTETEGQKVFYVFLLFLGAGDR